MIETVFVLYLITNLGPALHFEKKDVVRIYVDKDLCEIGAASRRNGVQPYMRLECLPEDFFK